MLLGRRPRRPGEIGLPAAVPQTTRSPLLGTRPEGVRQAVAERPDRGRREAFHPSFRSSVSSPGTTQRAPTKRSRSRRKPLSSPAWRPHQPLGTSAPPPAQHRRFRRFHESSTPRRSAIGSQPVSRAANRSAPATRCPTKSSNSFNGSDHPQPGATDLIHGTFHTRRQIEPAAVSADLSPL